MTNFVLVLFVSLLASSCQAFILRLHLKLDLTKSIFLGFIALGFSSKRVYTMNEGVPSLLHHVTSSFHFFAHVADIPPQHGVIKSATDGILLGSSMFL